MKQSIINVGLLSIFTPLNATEKYFRLSLNKGPNLSLVVIVYLSIIFFLGSVRIKETIKETNRLRTPKPNREAWQKVRSDTILSHKKPHFIGLVSV